MTKHFDRRAILLSGLCAGGGLAMPAIAASKQYNVTMQVWQDAKLLTQPTVTIPANERFELIVSDPDTVKISLLLRPGEKRKQIVVDGQVFLPSAGQWREAAAPNLNAELGKRSSLEYPIEQMDLRDQLGNRAQILRLQLLLKKA